MIAAHHSGGAVVQRIPRHHFSQKGCTAVMVARGTFGVLGSYGRVLPHLCRNRLGRDDRLLAAILAQRPLMRLNLRNKRRNPGLANQSASRPAGQIPFEAKCHDCHSCSARSMLRCQASDQFWRRCAVLKTPGRLATVRSSDNGDQFDWRRWSAPVKTVCSWLAIRSQSPLACSKLGRYL